MTTRTVVTTEESLYLVLRMQPDAELVEALKEIAESQRKVLSLMQQEELEARASAEALRSQSSHLENVAAPGDLRDIESDLQQIRLTRNLPQQILEQDLEASRRVEADLERQLAASLRTGEGNEAQIRALRVQLNALKKR